MIRINLLPFRSARKKENIRRHVSMFVLSLVFAGLALYYYQSTLNGQIQKLLGHQKTVEKKLAAMHKDAEEVDEIKKALDILKQKMEGIRLVKQKRGQPVKLMDTMTHTVVPKRMWFTSFSAGEDRVGITGIALDHKTVADFMTRLEKAGLFSSVNLSMLRQDKIKGLNLKRFEVTCDTAKMKGTALAKGSKK